MSTNWALPSIITQYDEPGAEQGLELSNILWDDSKEFSQLTGTDNGSLPTKGSLQHLARSPKVDIKTKTVYLKLCGFNFTNLPNVLSGIQLRLKMNRKGRVTDETVQLCLDDNLIGKNYGTFDLDPQKLYGGPADLWDTDLTISDVTNPSFGVILRFQAHPEYPHRDGAYIDRVELQIS
jgi:hypothetical protein